MSWVAIDIGEGGVRVGVASVLGSALPTVTPCVSLKVQEGKGDEFQTSFLNSDLKSEG